MLATRAVRSVEAIVGTYESEVQIIKRSIELTLPHLQNSTARAFII
jgi:hypothetical protein